MPTKVEFVPPTGFAAVDGAEAPDPRSDAFTGNKVRFARTIPLEEPRGMATMTTKLTSAIGNQHSQIHLSKELNKHTP